MILTLEVIGEQAEDLGAGSRKVFNAVGGTIGRLPDNDWVFPDPYVSGRLGVPLDVRGLRGVVVASLLFECFAESGRLPPEFCFPEIRVVHGRMIAEGRASRRVVSVYSPLRRQVDQFDRGRHG